MARSKPKPKPKRSRRAGLKSNKRVKANQEILKKYT
jgi:hypothetical protein